LKGRNHPAKTAYAAKNTYFFKFSSKNQLTLLGKIN